MGGDFPRNVLICKHPLAENRRKPGLRLDGARQLATPLRRSYWTIAEFFDGKRAMSSSRS